MGKEHELLHASRSGNSSQVASILESISKKTITPFSSFRRHPNINHQDVNGYTPLHHACLNGYLEIVRLLLAHNAVPDVKDIRGSTPLYLASWAGQYEIVKVLLSEPRKRIDVNVQTSDNETPLHCAAQHGHVFVLGILLAHGANPAIRNNSLQSALDLGAQFGRLKIVQTLLRLHPELLAEYRRKPIENSLNDLSCPDHSSNKCKFTHTCLHLASRNGHKCVVEVLLAAGVDVNLMTNAGTALHEATLCGKQTVVAVLLRAGIDVHAVDGNGQTALELLKDYPPHVTYGIVSLIQDFLFQSSVDYFKPQRLAGEINTDLLEDKNIECENHKIPPPTRDRANTTPNCATKKTFEVAEEAPTNISWEKYLQMKPINPDIENGLERQPTPRVERKTYPVYLNSNRHPSPCFRRAKCVDEYVKMDVPKVNINEVQFNKEKSYKPKPPMPSPRQSLDYRDYANVTERSSSDSNTERLCKYTTDDNNNSTHSPTPEFPPPTVTEAEHTILEYIQPINNKSKRTSLRLSEESELNLNAYLASPSPSRQSNVSDYVEKFVGDVPFAGLFKGSTLNLVSDDKDPDTRSLRLRSPSLVRSIVSTPSKKSSDFRVSLVTQKDFDEVGVWQEINTILENMGNEFEEERRKSSTSTIKRNKTNEFQIRNPADLQLRTSRAGYAQNWCHAPNTLIYGQILYTVYYLGSTIIRELHGTISTRKSIQKLKSEDLELEEELDANLVKDCNKLTKILKENNEKKRHKVYIAISSTGVKFIDCENMTTISVHGIENINCVCQDSDDLRYFAYITREGNLHYSHVFMVDNMDLATEIILTLGQAFEVAYQLAINSGEDQTK